MSYTPIDGSSGTSGSSGSSGSSGTSGNTGIGTSAVWIVSESPEISGNLAIGLDGGTTTVYINILDSSGANQITMLNSLRGLVLTSTPVILTITDGSLVVSLNVVTVTTGIDQFTIIGSAISSDILTGPSPYTVSYALKGLLNLAGSTNNGIITFNGTSSGRVESNLTFDGSTLNVDGSAIISGSASTTLVKITQTGTGNAFVVEDSTSPDYSAFTINNSGNIGIGTGADPTYKVYAYGTETVIFAQSVNNYGVHGSGTIGVVGEGGVGVQGRGYAEVGTIGIYGIASDFESGSGTYIGGKFEVIPTGYNYKYGVQIIDGSEGVNKVLVSQTSDGKSNWSDSLTGLISVSASTLYGNGSNLTGITKTISGTTSLDFGFSSGGEGDLATATVLNSNIKADSFIIYSVYASIDHEIYDSILDELIISTTNIVDGVSFEITALASNNTWGVYNINYKIIN